jgi:ankyrin repeat protein
MPVYLGTALHFTAIHGNPDIMNFLIDSGAPLEAMTQTGNTPLHLAVIQQNTNAVRVLVRRGANARAVNPQNDATPIGLSVYLKNAEAFEIFYYAGLLPMDEMIETPALHPQKPFYLAAYAGAKEVVLDLLKKGAKTDERSGNFSPLHAAAHGGDLETFQLLLKEGASLYYPNGHSLLYIAARYFNNSIVLDIIENHGNEPDWSTRASTQGEAELPEGTVYDCFKMLVNGTYCGIPGPIAFRLQFGWKLTAPLSPAEIADQQRFPENKFLFSPLFRSVLDVLSEKDKEWIDVIPSEVMEQCSSEELETLLIYAVAQGKVKTVQFLLEKRIKFQTALRHLKVIRMNPKRVDEYEPVHQVLQQWVNHLQRVEEAKPFLFTENSSLYTNRMPRELKGLLLDYFSFTPFSAQLPEPEMKNQ